MRVVRKRVFKRADGWCKSVDEFSELAQRAVN